MQSSLHRCCCLFAAVLLTAGVALAEETYDSNRFKAFLEARQPGQDNEAIPFPKAWCGSWTAVVDRSVLHTVRGFSPGPDRARLLWTVRRKRLAEGFVLECFRDETDTPVVTVVWAQRTRPEPYVGLLSTSLIGGDRTFQVDGSWNGQTFSWQSQEVELRQWYGTRTVDVGGNERWSICLKHPRGDLASWTGNNTTVDNGAVDRGEAAVNAPLQNDHVPAADDPAQLLQFDCWQHVSPNYRDPGDERLREGLMNWTLRRTKLPGSRLVVESVLTQQGTEVFTEVRPLRSADRKMDRFVGLFWSRPIANSRALVTRGEWDGNSLTWRSDLQNGLRWNAVIVRENATSAEYTFAAKNKGGEVARWHGATSADPAAD